MYVVNGSVEDKCLKKCSMNVEYTYCWFPHNIYVTTLTLGSRPRQGLARLWAKRKPGSEGKCEGMDPHTPKELSLWEFGVPMDS
jgi:hypothetical protein